jgi:hypothetical protein
MHACPRHLPPAGTSLPSSHARPVCVAKAVAENHGHKSVGWKANWHACDLIDQRGNMEHTG